MAVDNKVPRSEAGIAGFEKESWGNRQEWQFQDTPALVQTTIEVTASGADIEIDFLDVLAASGEAAEQAGATAAARANFIAATTITVADGETATVPVYASGHFTMDALNWDDSFTTDAQKKAAFQGSLSPTLFVSKAVHDSDAIY